MKISEEARRELVRAYLEDGVPVRVLAEKLGVGTNTIYLHLYAVGVKGKRGHHAKTETQTCLTCEKVKRLSEFQPGYRQRCRECHKAWRFANGYNRGSLPVKAADFNRLNAEQGGKCFLCEKPGKLVADHDHNTGVVRGLLCYKCNAAMQGVEDPEWLARALEYRKRDTGIRWSVS